MRETAVRTIVVSTFITLDGVVQAPGAPERSKRQIHARRVVVSLLRRNDAQDLSTSATASARFAQGGRRIVPVEDQLRRSAMEHGMSEKPQ
jgi:hypothetical protein